MKNEKKNIDQVEQDVVNHQHGRQSLSMDDVHAIDIKVMTDDD